ALLTSFYSWRLVFLTFFGKPRWIESEHIQHAVHHAHDEPEEHNPPRQEDAGSDAAHAVPDPDHQSGAGGYHPAERPLTTLVPRGVLASGAVSVGYLFTESVSANEGCWGASSYYSEPLVHALHVVPYWVKLTATFVMLLGFAIAWHGYTRNTAFPAKVAEQL